MSLRLSEDLTLIITLLFAVTWTSPAKQLIEIIQKL